MRPTKLGFIATIVLFLGHVASCNTKDSSTLSADSSNDFITCVNISLDLSNSQARDSGVGKCIDKYLGVIDSELCARAAKKIGNSHQEARAMGKCTQIGGFDACFETAKKVKKYHRRDYAIIECIEKFRSKITLQQCADAAKKIRSNSRKKYTLSHTCLED